MRVIDDPEELIRIKHFMSLAADVAKRSVCKKSQRGVVIVKDNQVVGEGHNEPTFSDKCCLRSDIHDNSKTELCFAVHAEQLAIINTPSDLRSGATMFHTKVKQGVEVPTGPPSCTQCSKMVVESGIKEFVLWQKTDHGPKFIVYPAQEFNKLSFDYFLS